MSSTTAPSSPSSGPPPPPKYIKIISSEGHSFFLPRAVACAGSTTLAAMLRGGEDEDDTYSFMEGREGVVRLPDIRSRIVEKVCQYLLYKEQYAHSTGTIPTFEIEPEVSLELLVASNYLDC
uniref:Elongin-C n=1 Tax=Corethron hystrix TaxID=216773 RepID=A0A7S1BC12_9STRA|mmetsp:Transcript_20452/g.46424  ORF Transcript_20452/g.46424 Transcript_20452/m.46424 type:complete len:122 (+) Transcript_20452:116-481(+)